MSTLWLTTERARDRLAAETQLFSANSEGEIPICLIYPNRYPIGMSNLGFQAAYRIFSQATQYRCERAFLPDPDEADVLSRTQTPLVSLENQRLLLDFELLAFSLSFETDYLHILDILAAAHVPLLARERANVGPRKVVHLGTVVDDELDTPTWQRKRQGGSAAENASDSSSASAGEDKYDIPAFLRKQVN